MPPDTRVPALLLYDRMTDQWTVSDGGVSSSRGGWLGDRLVSVGANGGVIGASVYDVTTNQWTRSPPPPADFPSPATFTVIASPLIGDEVVYVVPAAGPELRTYRLDVTTMTWSRTATGASLSTGSEVYTSARYAAATRTPDARGSEMHVYDAIDDRWAVFPVPPALQSTSGYLLHSHGRILWNNLAYDPVADRWAKTSIPPVPTDAQRFFLKNGKNDYSGADYIECTGCSATPSCTIWRFPQEFAPYCSP